MVNIWESEYPTPIVEEDEIFDETINYLKKMIDNDK